MTSTNEIMRAALREIENRAAVALANQPNETDECGRHLKNAISGITVASHIALWRSMEVPSIRKCAEAIST